MTIDLTDLVESDRAHLTYVFQSVLDLLEQERRSPVAEDISSQLDHLVTSMEQALDEPNVAQFHQLAIESGKTLKALVKKSKLSPALCEAVGYLQSALNLSPLLSDLHFERDLHGGTKLWGTSTGLAERDHEFCIELDVRHPDPNVEQALQNHCVEAIELTPRTLAAMQNAYALLDSVAFVSKEGDTQAIKDELETLIESLSKVTYPTLTPPAQMARQWTDEQEAQHQQNHEARNQER